MGVVTIYPFDNTANYAKVNTEVSSGAGRLVLTSRPSQIFNQPFTSGTGFTSDAAQTEFVAGLMQQKDQRPTGAPTFGANFDRNKDGNWGEGNLTTTLNGAAILVDKKCSLSVGGDVEIIATSKLNANKGSIKLLWTPNFSGNPAADQFIFDFANSSGSALNKLSLKMDTTKAWRVTANTNTGAPGIVNGGLGSQTVVAGTPYELSFNWDFSVPVIRFFIDGAQQDGDMTTAVVRDDNLTSITYIKHGGTGADFIMDDIIYYPTTQETAPYAPGYTISDFAYGKRLANDDAMFHANYNSNINGTWGNGSLVATPTGSPVITSGRLDLTASTTGVTYLSPNNFDMLQKGALRFEFVPTFTATTPTTVWVVSIFDNPALNNNLVKVSITTNILSYRIYDSTGVLLFTIAVFISSFVSGTPVEIEINWDISAGVNRIFFDGVQQGATDASTGTRTGSTAMVMGVHPLGSAGTGFSIDNLISFSEPQHTANYAPGEAIPINNYTGDVATLPLFNYTEVGQLQALTDLNTTELGTLKYIIEGKYWNGSAWVTSTNEFESNDKATVIANIATLVVLGEANIEVKIVFNASNIQGSIDVLDLEYTGEQYETEGTLLTNISFIAKDLTNIIATEIVPANTSIKYIMDINGNDFYHDGANWVASINNTQSNTLAELQTNAGSLLTVNSTVKIKVVLTTTDQQATPEIDIIVVTYDFGVLEPPPPTQSQVVAFIIDSENQPLAGATVTIGINRNGAEYKEAAKRIIGKNVVKTTDVNGFFSANLIISDDYEVVGTQKMRYILSITLPGQKLPVFLNGGPGKIILFEVPNQPITDITDQIGAI